MQTFFHSNKSPYTLTDQTSLNSREGCSCHQASTTLPWMSPGPFLESLDQQVLVWSILPFPLCKFLYVHSSARSLSAEITYILHTHLHYASYNPTFGLVLGSQLPHQTAFPVLTFVYCLAEVSDDKRFLWLGEVSFHREIIKSGPQLALRAYIE